MSSPENFRRWLERISQIEAEAARQRRERYAPAVEQEWNAEPYRHGSRCAVERLIADLNRKWRAGK